MQPYRWAEHGDGWRYLADDEKIERHDEWNCGGEWYKMPSNDSDIGRTPSQVRVQFRRRYEASITDGF